MPASKSAYRSIFTLLAMLLVLVTLPGISSAERFVPDATYTNWSAIGMERAWQAQVEAGRGKSPVQLTIHPSRRKTTKAFEVVYPGGSKLFAPDQLDRYGNRLGEAGAAAAADVEKRVLATRNIKAEVVTHETPKVMVYAQSSRGLLHAIDGESGEQRWKFPTGNPRYPNVPVAANDQYVAAVNGSTLYVVDLNDGKLLFQRQLSNAPGAGLAITQEHIFVPVTGNIVEAFRLNEKERRRPAIRFSSAGDTRFQPLATPQTISWPTGRGFLYVVDTEEQKVRYRLEARSPIVEHSAYLAPDRLYAASQGGYLFSVEEKSGRMMWQFSAGEAIVHAPVAVGKHVYIVTDKGILMAVNAKTGLQDWQTRGISQVLSVGKDRLVCRGARSNIVTVDLSSGSRMDSVQTSNADQYIANPYSDRVYVATKTGRVICLKPLGTDWPTIHVTPMTKEELEAEKEAKEKGKKEKKPKKTAAPKTDSSGSDDIFGDDSADTGETSDDIFGDDADAGGDADADDIFGDDAGGAVDDGGDDIFGDDSGEGGEEDIFGGDDEDIFGDEGF